MQVRTLKKQFLDSRFSTSMCILFLKKRFYLFIFRQRGREGEREGEKHQCVVVSYTSPAGDPATTQAGALTGNRTSDTLVPKPVLCVFLKTCLPKNKFMVG